MKDSVKILFIGDEGVGKSSLLSTFISRHFPQEVPSVVSDTIIPSDAVADGVCVTIMDSSARMADREALRAKISLADTIIFLHDVSRPETFDSIVHLWIPLVKDVVQSTRKPYLLLGTKVDLVNINEDEESDEMLNEILAEYPDFDIFGSCMCSSLRLQNIDNVIKVAFTNVLHPVLPLFDPQNELTSLAYQAFSRIFRILDEDGDNLLNDEDMTALHYYCFSESIDLDATDLVGLKKLLESRNPESLSENGDVTFIGFTEYCKSSLEQERLHVPWTILRHYHYDDDLNIQIPPAVLTLPKLKKGQSYRLSDHAIRFLLITARNAFEENTRAIKSATDSDSTSEVEDCLTSAALKSIFAILPREHYENHPWLNPPHYQSVWPYDTRRIDPIEQFTLLNKFPHDNANLSFDAWLIHWNTLAFSEPVLVQKYLFLLGYVDRPDFGITVQSGNIYSVYKQRLEQAKSSNYFWKNQQTAKTISTPRSLTYPIDTKVPIPPEVRPRSAGGPKRKHMINICILGDNDVGKSSFAWLFSGLRLPGRNNPFFIEDEIVEKSIEYEKPYETIVIGGSMLQIEDELATSLSRTNLNNFTIPGELRPSPLSINPNNQGNGKVVYFSISSIPMEHVDVWREKSIHQYDIIFLMFSCDSRKSVDTVLALEKQLPSNIPRHYLCNKMDLLQTPMQGKDEIHQIYEENAERISLHTKEHDLLPFTPISNLTGEAITEVVPIIKELYRRPEGGIKKDVKHVKTWKENFWQFLLNPIGSIFSSTSNIDDDERLGRVGLFTPSSVVLMTGFALLGVFGGSYFLAQYNSTVRFYYQQMMKDVQTWINLTTNWLNGLTLTFPAAFQLSNRKDGTRTSDQHAVRGGVNGDSWSTYLAETMTWLTKK